MAKYEYLTQYDPDMNAMNELGKKGWKLVSIDSRPEHMMKSIYVFIKKKKSIKQI